MPTEKLTKKVVDQQQPGAAMYEVRDSLLKGFGVRVYPSGTKAYFYSYTRPGPGPRRQGFVKIGEHGSPWTVDAARKEATDLAYSVKQLKVDPQLQRRTAEQDAVTLAFDKYAELFISRYLPARWPRWQGEATRLLRREAIPHFKSKPLTAIAKRDVTAFFDTLLDRPGIAKNTSTVLRKLFNWAETRGDIAASPMLRIELPPALPERNRYLCDVELAALWATLTSIDHPYSAVLRTLILVGQRRDEVAEMRWEEVDLERALWTIPGARTKNKKDHEVPLGAMALDELRRRPTRQGWLFTVSGKGPVQNWSYWKRKLDPLFEAHIQANGHSAPEPWRLHDVRRSVATGLQRLGVNRDWIEVLQNRALPGRVASGYQQHEFLPEKRLCIEAWEGHLLSLLQRANGGDKETAAHAAE